MIDEKVIQDWIDSLEADLLSRVQEHRENGGVGSPGYYRINGALNFLSVLEADLNAGYLTADPTPVKDIKVTVQNIVRSKDPSTSWDAAIQQTSEKRQALYSKIRTGLHAMGRSTDEMLSDYVRTAFPAYKFSPSGLRTRRAELVKAGWVKADGKMTLRNGNQATAWVHTD